MSTTILLRFVALLYLALGAYTVALAQDSASISIHRLCEKDGEGGKMHLRYWYPEVSNGIPEPVCVLTAAEFGGQIFRSVRIEANQTPTGATVVVEYDQSARPLIEKMSRDNVSKLIAIVVGNKIVSMPMVTQPYSDTKLLIATPSRNDAERIVAVLNQSSKKPRKQ